MRPGVARIQTAYSVAVLAALCLPLVLWGLGPERLARARPEASRWPETPRTSAAVRAWPKAVEDFVNDRLGLREAAVRGYYGLMYFGLRTSPTPKVVRGRQSWLFYNSCAEPRGYWTDSIADARRSRPLSTRKLDAIADMIRTRNELVRGWHGRYLFVVVPNKSSVYPEYLPAALTPVGLGKPLEQLDALLAPAPASPFLDLTPVLLSAKQREEVYYHTDSHWNELGALRGLIAIMRALQADYPGLRLPHEDDFVVRQEMAAGRGLARMLNLEPFLREPRWQLTPRADLALPTFQRQLRVWVYHDSFFNTLPHVWRAFFPGLVLQDSYRPWSDDDVRTARPDVVIQLSVERRLRYKGADPGRSL